MNEILKRTHDVEIIEWVRNNGYEVVFNIGDSISIRRDKSDYWRLVKDGDYIVKTSTGLNVLTKEEYNEYKKWNEV